MHRLRTSSYGVTRVALALVALALVLRVMVPPGWMPIEGGKGYAITLCTGSGAVQAWIDAEGKLHKQKPAGVDRGQHCAFAGIGGTVDLPELADVPAPLLAAAEPPAPRSSEVRIGQGLAAPPPPATGPPAAA